MNVSTVDRTRTRPRPGTPATPHGVRPRQATPAIDPVEFTEPDRSDNAAEHHPGADRSAENMRVLRTPFTPSPVEACTAA
ncbi:hypothetical protein OOZ19_10000 [Saccharopolyspora sp. NFXS83]|uniref:hypothetical protein n=1 Tax=Saccharopolyspora sp. NFXS83 TaxID=2993560 RepID=UPI00224AE558|nr:hypothetical protein [Saccharopolyspora sp. NFXS83]MCX2730573.1 hypothetical protein [Saccharopolyspora sp. NFXS83]